MSLSDERFYILQLSNRLEQFHQVRPDLWNSRCPMCGDSKKNPNKKRFYIYRKGDGYSVKCHNCHRAMRFMVFMKIYFPHHYEQACVDKYKPEIRKPKVDLPTTSAKARPTLTQWTTGGYDFSELTRIQDLPESHIAVKTLIDRKIPKKWWSRHIFYCQDFIEFLYNIGEVERAERYSKYGTERRLIIPFYNTNMECNVFQGRSLEENPNVRYITIKKTDDADRVWGLDRIDPSKPVITLEGPIDAMFLPNTIAMAGSMVKTPGEFKKVFILDNEPRLKDLYHIYKKLIKKGETVSFFDNKVKEKDINDMILAGYTPKQLVTMIFKNACYGMEALMKLEDWRK